MERFLARYPMRRQRRRRFALNYHVEKNPEALGVPQLLAKFTNEILLRSKAMKNR